MSLKVFAIFVFAFFAAVVYATPIDKEKPFVCPANEKYYKCSLEVCYKTCRHLVNSPPCPSISADCYQPSCECIENYLRKDDGECVPYDKCPKNSEG